MHSQVSSMHGNLRSRMWSMNVISFCRSQMSFQLQRRAWVCFIHIHYIDVKKYLFLFFSHTFQFQFKTGSTQCAFHSECCVELCKNCIRNSIEFDLVITIIFLVFNLINKMGQYAVSEHCTALHRHTHKHTHTFFLSFKCGSCVSTCSTFRYVRFIEQNVSCLYGRAVCLFRRCRFIHSFIRFEHVHNNNINRSQLQQ